MGYTTSFAGKLKLNKPATPEQVKYINTFSGTRRIKRDPEKLLFIYDGEHGYPGLEKHYGKEGEYFARDDGDMGQNKDASIIDYNTPPLTQPGLWCQWVLTPDGKYLMWDGGEKFNNYVEWLRYMIENFFAGWGIVIDGKLKWKGEDTHDRGTILVVANVITILEH